MTLNYDSEQDLASRFNDIEKYMRDNGKRAGSFNGIDIWHAKYNSVDLYGIFIKSENLFVGFLSFHHIKYDKEYLQFLNAYILPKYRNNGYVTKVLWFVKDRYGKSIIDYGVLSGSGLKLYKSLNATGRFKLYWMNTDTLEKADIEDTNQKISDIETTKWRIVIEKSDGIGLDMNKDGNSGNIIAGMYKLFEDVGY